MRAALLPAALLSLLLLAAGCAGPTEGERKESAARMQIGVTFLQQQRLPDAMRQLARAKELDPDNADVDLALGLAYWQRNLQGGERSDLLLAERHLRTAVRKRKNNADAHNNLGIVLGFLDRGDEAIEHFRKAGEDVYYGTPERAYYNMGNEYRRQRKPELAEKAFRRSITLNERYAEPYLALSSLFEEKSMPHEAAETLAACARMAPGDLRCRVEQGRVLRDQGKVGEARRLLEEILRESPDPAVKARAEDLLRSLGAPGKGGGA